LDQPRIISLSPWGTGVLAETGLDRWLVGISHKCRVPESAGNLPVVTKPMENDQPLPEDFLQLPRHFPTMILSPFNVDPGILISLKPSHIITESLSPVCRISVNDIEQQLFEWLGYKVKVVHLSDANLGDIFGSVKSVIHALGLPDSNMTAYDKCRKQLTKAGKKMASKKHQPLIGVLMNYFPARFAGRYFSELIPLVGATPLNWPHDIWIPDPVYAYPVPHKVIVAEPDTPLEKQREKLIRYASKILSLWGVNCRIKFYPVDGPDFWDKSCSGLLTTLETIGEIVLDDPKHQQRKGTVWDHW